MPKQASLYHQDLISEDIDEVINYRPHWIVRKGNTLFFVIILLLLGLTWVIKYPDKITASAKLVALNPPKLLTAKTEGKLLKLLVSNEKMVVKGQFLGYMESTVNYNQVIELQHWINTALTEVKESKYANLLKEPLPLLTTLGELQSSYQNFQNQYEASKQTLANGYFPTKKNALQKDIDYIGVLKKNTEQEKEIQEKDKQLQENELETYEKLAKLQYISQQELNQYKSKLLAKEQSLKQTSSQLTNTDISKHSKQKEILDLKKETLDLQQLFFSSLLQLKSDIEEWVQQYVFVAPEDGKVLYVSSLTENQFVSLGQNLFYIQPGETHYYAELIAGQQGFGKIKEGQKVILKVDSYPSTEFGYLTGLVTYLSSIPSRQDSFLVKVSLTHGLQTNYNKYIFFRNDLKAKAEVITEEQRLFKRLIGQLKQLGAR